jgi:hypothetical protein
MGFGRKSHFYCEVESSRAHTEKICADRGDGLTITAAGWKGAIRLRIGHYTTEGDCFELRFIPWQKSESNSSGLLLAEGRLNYDEVGTPIEQAAASYPLVRLTPEMKEVLELLQAKRIMLEGIPNTKD